MGILDWFTKRKKEDDIFSLDDKDLNKDVLSEEDDVFKTPDVSSSQNDDVFKSPEMNNPQHQFSGMEKHEQQNFPQQNYSNNRYQSQPIRSQEVYQQEQPQNYNNKKDMENLDLKIDMLKMMINNIDQKITRMENTLKQYFDSENRRKYY